MALRSAVDSSALATIGGSRRIRSHRLPRPATPRTEEWNRAGVRGAPAGSSRGDRGEQGAIRELSAGRSPEPPVPARLAGTRAGRPRRLYRDRGQRWGARSATHPTAAPMPPPRPPSDSVSLLRRRRWCSPAERSTQRQARHRRGAMPSALQRARLPILYPDVRCASHPAMSYLAA